MKAVAVQSTSDSESARKQPKADVRPVPLSPRFSQTAVRPDGAVVQRKTACACGGGCPGCMRESDGLKVQTKLLAVRPAMSSSRKPTG